MSGALTGGSGCKKASSEATKSGGGDIVLGAILGLSGEDSSLGIETKEGLEIALAELNDAGGVKGRKLQVLYEDTRLQGPIASEKIQKLIDRDRALLVIGDAGSGPTLAARSYAEKSKVPLVSGSATNVDVTKGARYVFRVCFTDDYQGAAAAKLAREVLKADRVAMIWPTGNRYSEGLQKIFAEEFEKRGGKIVERQTYQQGETNIVAFLTKVKEANPQLIFAPVYPSDLTRIGPTKKSIGLDAPMLGTDGWDGPATLAKGVIETLEGSLFTDLYAADSPNPLSKAFVDKYKAKYAGKMPSSLAASGYDVLKLVADAIGRAKAIDSESVRDALEQTKAFSGVTGTFDIDEGHNAKKPVVVMKVANGAFKYDQSISL
ncbi:MAG: ABC transporter substrate-binding protein [Polyangiales bacterium]